MPVAKIWDGSQWVEVGGWGIAHDILNGSAHPDTAAQSVTRGSIIVGSATPKWDELTIGAAARYLRSDGTDLAYAQIPASEVVNTPAGGIAATDVQAALNELDSEKAGIADTETITGYPWTFGNVRIDANTGFIEFWDGTDWGIHLYGTPTDILGLDSHFRLPQGKEFRIHVGGDTVCGWGRDAGGNLYLKDTPAGTITLVRIDDAVVGTEHVINDDAATSFTPPAPFGIIVVYGRHTNYKEWVGIFSYRTSATAFVQIITAKADFDATTGVLAGTTGADGHMTISAHTDGKIYLENRIGQIVSVVCLISGS